MSAELREDDGRFAVAPLLKPLFVVNRGFTRWGDEARRRWLLELRAACVEVVRRIDEVLG